MSDPLASHDSHVEGVEQSTSPATPPVVFDADSPSARRIQGAIAQVGPSHPDDVAIQSPPAAERFEEQAPAFAHLLRGAKLEVAAERHQRLDARAVEAQARYERYASRARAAVFWAGLGAAALLATGALASLLAPIAARVLAVAFTAVGVVASAIAVASIRSLRNGELLERWMSARAEAEMERLRYFHLLAHEGEGVDPLLKLEFFRRHQLDVQRRYYASREATHREDADRAFRVSGTAMAFGGAASGLAGVLAASVGPPWAGLAALGLTAQAVATRTENREASAQARRNAERYDRTRAALDALYGNLDEVRVATASGGSAVLHAYVESVHQHLSLEHRQWVDEMATANEALDRLEHLLDEYVESRGDKA
jgi:hypothetical protein